MDKSNGYDQIAARFAKLRGESIDGIGSSSVRSWARTLPPASTVLDLGCGTGLPLTNVLAGEGMHVYGIDASATLVQNFRKNFPNAPVMCEAVEESMFFDRTFDGILAWGLLFLISREAQVQLIGKTAKALNRGGKLLFTAPHQHTTWIDVMTEQQSLSLGSATYKQLLAESGLTLLEEFEDEGENHYYSAAIESST